MFDAAGLQRMRDIMRRHVDDGSVPGLVTCVSRKGETHIDVFGVAVDGSSTATKRDTIFRISSMTKPITAVAALILVDECKLRLDDPIARFVPELASPRVLRVRTGALEDTVAARRAITTRDLLTFTCGHGLVLEPCPYAAALFGPEINGGPPHPARMPSPDEWLKRLAKLPLAAQPGEAWLYNTGADIVGVVVERASGKPFAEFVRERICEPLGMKDTAFFVDASKRARFTTCTATSFQTGASELYDGVDGEWSKPPSFALGGAGLVSTVDDYLAFARMLLGGGALGTVRVLSRASVAMMTSDQLTPALKAAGGLVDGMWNDAGWGFGVSVATKRTQPWSVGSYGWNGGLGSDWHNDPEEDAICILLTNRAWPSPTPPPVIRDFTTSAYAAFA